MTPDNDPATTSAPVEHDPQRTGLVRALGLWDCVSLVMGIMVGSGIFLMAGAIALEIDSLMIVISVWALGGLLSLCGAVALSELGAAMPDAGGLYVYLTRAYGPGLGFVYGWSAVLLIHSGGLATLAAAVALYAGPMLGLGPAEQKGLGLLCLAVFVVINCLGVTVGKWAQNILTATKVVGLVVMTVLLYCRGSVSRIVDHWAPAGWDISWTAIGVALLAVLWAYDGWHFVSFAAGEVKRPSRTLPAAMLVGTILTLIIYIFVNMAYYSVLAPEEIRGTHRVAATAIEHAFGGGAALMLSVLIVISMLGAMNGIMLGAARVSWAMANNGLFFRSFARLSPRYHTPVVATVAQGILAAVFTLVGTFQQLFTSYIFASWIFYGLAVAGVIVLRRKEPDLQRPYRCPWYPATPLFFVVATLAIVVSTIVANFAQAALGIGLILMGVPLYFLFRRYDQRRASRG